LNGEKERRLEGLNLLMRKATLNFREWAGGQKKKHAHTWEHRKR